MADKKQRKTPERLPIGERARFNVPVFEDEYDGLGLSGDMSLAQAQATLRAALGVAVPVRHGAKASLSGMAAAIRDASPDVRAQVVALLSGANVEQTDE